MSSRDDRDTPARIRDAAVELVAARGWERVTLRDIARAADVPVGLVSYHFGSKEGLRQACDDWIISQLSDTKTQALIGGPLNPSRVSVDHPELRPVTDYVGQSIRYGGPVAEHFFDRMIEFTQGFMAQGEADGTMRAYDDPYAMAVLYVVFGAGASLLDHEIARRFGGESLLDPATYGRYLRATLEIFTHPLFVDDRYLRALDQTTDSSPATAEDAPKEN